MSLCILRCIAICLLVNPFALLGQLPVNPEPAWADPSAVNLRLGISSDEVYSGYSILLNEYTYNHSEKAAYYHYAREILNETGVSDGADLYINYDEAYQELKLHRINILRKGQELNVIDQCEFRVTDVMEPGRRNYRGQKNISIHLQDVRQGDVIEYSYTLKGSNPVYGNHFSTKYYIDSYEPAGKMAANFLFPKDKEVRIVTKAPRIRKVEGEKHGMKFYGYSIDKFEGIESEGNVPSWYEDLRFIMLSDFSGWSEYKAFMKDLFVRQDKAETSIRETALQVTESINGEPEKVKALVRFVQDEIRYLGFEEGIYNITPFPPGKTLEQRFGDCKDKSLLLIALLREIGVESHPALVSTYYKGKVSEYLPGFNVFNHCIVKITMNGDVFWVDPTAMLQGGPLGEIQVGNYEKALVLDDAESELEPVVSKIVSSIKLYENITLSTLTGPGKLKVITTYSGSEADEMRRRLNGTPIAELEKRYLSHYEKLFEKIWTSSTLETSDKRELNELVVTESYKFEGFFQEGSDGLGEAQVYPSLLSEYISSQTYTGRRAPLALRYPVDIDHKIRILFPKPWNIEEVDSKEEGEGFYFRQQVERNGRQVLLNYHYETSKPEVKARHAEAVSFIHKKIADESGYTFYSGESLSGVEGQEASAFSNISGTMLLITVLVLFIGFWLIKKVNRYDPEPRSRIESPRNIGGWLILPVIGLFLSPILLIIHMVDGTFYNGLILNSLSETSSPSYNPSLYALIVFELIINIVTLLFAVALIFLVIKRRTSAPTLMIAYYCFLVCVQILDLLLYSVVTGENLDQANVSGNEVIKSMVSAAIWVPYFQLSERVKETFICRYQPKEETPLEINPVS